MTAGQGIASFFFIEKEEIGIEEEAININLNLQNLLCQSVSCQVAVFNKTLFIAIGFHTQFPESNVRQFLADNRIICEKGEIYFSKKQGHHLRAFMIQSKHIFEKYKTQCPTSWFREYHDFLH